MNYTDIIYNIVIIIDFGFIDFTLELKQSSSFTRRHVTSAIRVTLCNATLKS